MKNLLGIILFVGVMFSGHAQNHSTIREKLVGIWGLNYEKTLKKMDSLPKKRFMSNARLQTRIASNYQGRQLFFGSTGDFRQNQPNGREVGGSWIFVEGESIVKITSPEGKEFYYEVLKLNSSQLILSSVRRNKGNPYFKELYYDKQ